MRLNEYIDSNQLEDNSFFNDIISLMPKFVRDQAEYKHVSPKQIILQKGDPLTHAVIVISGDVTVLNEFESGKVFEPVIIHHSDFTGVVEIILNMEDTIATNVAVNDVRYIKIPRKTFLKWLDVSHIITKYILKSVCSNFQKNMMESGEAILLDSMYLFVSHTLKNASYSPATKLYILKETREKTSTRTGINLRTLYRHIKRLRDGDYISNTGRNIVYNETQKEALQALNQSLRKK